MLPVKKTVFIMILLLNCVYTFDGFSTLAGRLKRDECVPVEIKQCKKWYDSRRPHDMYSSTSLDHKTGKMLIQQLSNLPASTKHCAKDAIFLLCSIFSPVCFKGMSDVLKPCKNVCIRWKKTCGHIFKNVALPQELDDCDELPDHDSLVCIQPETFSTIEEEKKEKQKKKRGGKNKKKCECEKSSNIKPPKYRNYRKAIYVIEASLISRETLANGNTKILMNVTNIFKEGKIPVKIGKFRAWSQCFCHKNLDYSTKYFFLLSESTKKKKVEINNKSLILPYEKYHNKITKWSEKCKRKNCDKRKSRT